MKIRLGSEGYRTQTKEINKHVIEFLLFVSSKPHCKTEFLCIENSLLEMNYTPYVKFRGPLTSSAAWF